MSFHINQTYGEYIKLFQISVYSTKKILSKPKDILLQYMTLNSVHWSIGKKRKENYPKLK